MLCAAVALAFVVAPKARAEEEVLHFTPIAPCRAFNTAGYLHAGHSRDFIVTGDHAATFTRQGGPAAGCGIPEYAKAVAVNFSAVSPAAAGHFRAYPYGAPIPPTTVLNYQAGVNTTGGATVALNGLITVLAGSGATKVVGDVTGYYTKRITGLIAADGTILHGNGSIVGSVKSGVNNYRLEVDRDVRYCAPIVTPAPGYTGNTAYVYANANTNNVKYISIQLWQLNGSTESAYASPFYISVHC
ncbi:hypothetical protein [Methylopila sp. M107]|uniref:hypothetical protein n=1 Tax=Methylopila sp. M107 TaxID=1101190 RepID=UPI0012DD0A5B|nr:hypothetical protein [Methylopila sp. M107]